MIVRIPLQTTLDVENGVKNVMDIFNALQDNLNLYFKDLEFGIEIKKLNFTFLILDEKGRAFYSKTKDRIKYLPGLKEKKLHGVVVKLQDMLEINIMLSSKIFIATDEKEKFILSAILNFLKNKKTLPKNLIKFDKKMFIKKLEYFIENEI